MYNYCSKFLALNSSPLDEDIINDVFYDQVVNKLCSDNLMYNLCNDLEVITLVKSVNRNSFNNNLQHIAKKYNVLPDELKVAVKEYYNYNAVNLFVNS